MRRAIYPGSFDPITYGHLDIVKRSLNLFDELIIGIGVNSTKNSFLSVEEKISLIQNVINNHCSEYKDRIKIIHYNGLIINFAKEQNCKFIIRGIRAFTDFDYEFTMAGTNSKIDSSIETVFLMAAENNQFISSNTVKEILSFGGSIDNFTTKEVVEYLQNNKSKIK